MRPRRFVRCAVLPLLAAVAVAGTVWAHSGSKHATTKTPATPPIPFTALDIDAHLAGAVQSALDALPPHPSGAATQRPAVHTATLKRAGRSGEIAFNLSRDILALGIGSAAFENAVHAIHTAAFDALVARGEALPPDLTFRILIDGIPLHRHFVFEQAMIAAAEAAGGAPRAPSMLPKSVASRRVAVSPGHGWTFYSGGWNLQRAYFSGIVEDFANSEFTIPLNDLLKSRGALTRPTRELDKTAGNGESGRAKWQESARNYVKSLGLPASIWDSLSSGDDYDDDIRVRPLYANWADADGNRAEILVSLHNNGGGGTGTETWYDTANGFQTESKRLADTVHNKVISAIRSQFNAAWPNRLVKGSAGGYGENRLATRPAIIVEIAFMDRQSPDNDAIQNAQFRQIVSTAVADGIAEFFANQVDVAPPTAPAGLAGEAKSQSQIDLSWSPATDASACSPTASRATACPSSKPAVPVSPTPRSTPTPATPTPSRPAISPATGPPPRRRSSRPRRRPRPIWGCGGTPPSRVGA